MEQEAQPAPLVVAVVFSELPDDARLRVEGAHPAPTLLDLSAAIYDFTLTYEIAVISSLPEYTDYNLANFFVVGRNRPVHRDHQLRVKQITYASPFQILGFIPKAVSVIPGIVEAFVRAIEIVYTAPVRLRVSKKRLQLEETVLDRQILQAQEQLQLERLRQRTEDYPLQLTNAEVRELGAGDAADA
jgi:hypothetical protein